MTLTARTLAQYPAGEDLVLAGRPLRPGVALETTSRFADPVWELGPAILQKHARDARLDFATVVPARHRGTAKELFHTMLSGPLPPDEPRLAISTIHAAFARVARFLTWLDTCQPTTGRSTQFAIEEVTATELTAYQQHVGLTAASGMVRAQACAAVRLLWRYRRSLGDGLTMDPAVLDGWSVPVAHRGENATNRIPEEVLGPLVGWALRFVRDFAPDVLAAVGAAHDYRHPRRLNRRGDNRGVGERIQTVLDGYVAARAPLPGHEHGPNLTFLAWQARCRTSSLYYGDRPAAVEAAARIVGVAPHSQLPVPIRGCLDGRPWLDGIPVSHPLESVDALARILFIACYITIAYLSGMRDSEIKHLRRGCLHVHRTPDGTPYCWSVRSLAFKGEYDPQGTAATWTVGEPAALAVTLLEQLRPDTSGDLLFAAFDATPARGTVDRGYREAFGTDTTNQQLQDFITWINRYCHAHSRSDTIPDVDGRPWPLRTRQFRRTLAWFIARRPGGSIAGAIQYRHLSIHMFEGYAGTSDSGFRAEVEAEQALTRGETLLAMATEHDHPSLTGPAAPEATWRLDTFADAFAGSVVTDPRRLKRILRRADPAVYPGKYVTCVFKPDTALLPQEACCRIAPQPGSVPATGLRERRAHQCEPRRAMRRGAPHRARTRKKTHSSAAAAAPPHRATRPHHRVPEPSRHGDVMTRHSCLPTDNDVRAALEALCVEGETTTGGPPTVIALARRVGLANTTFRRNFPTIVAEIGRILEDRGKPASSQRGSTTLQRLTEQNARLRHINRELTDQLALAMATIQRLCLDNHQLRAELEGVCNVGHISTRPPRR
ncbi:hypothetical protein [Amycolatopsis kentuckyensis]|uniref:hypothetical protein n=1 Tax=Amycolatopsis kentuckyensis TaxID=218823 RepID=UPI00356924B0